MENLSFAFCDPQEPERQRVRAQYAKHRDKRRAARRARYRAAVGRKVRPYPANRYPLGPRAVRKPRKPVGASCPLCGRDYSFRCTFIPNERMVKPNEQEVKP